MSSITGRIEFFTDPTSMTARDLRITVEQDFDILRGFEGLELEADGAAEVCVYAGEMLLWVGTPDEMSGWLKPLVDAKIKEGDWGIESGDMREAVSSARDESDFHLAHGPGRI